MKRFAVWILFVFCLLSVDAFAATSKDITVVLGDLEKMMAEVRTIQADYTQEKNLALFNQKILLKGKVFIQKPGFLSWRVFTPLRYSMVIKGTTISQWDEDTNQVQQVSLARNPSFQVAIEQMQNWFSGAYTSMTGDYAITAVSEKPLVLEFVPNENALARNFIARVEVSFRNDERYLKELRIEEKNGDSTVLIFMNTVLNDAIPASAWEVKANVR